MLSGEVLLRSMIVSERSLAEMLISARVKVRACLCALSKQTTQIHSIASEHDHYYVSAHPALAYLALPLPIWHCPCLPGTALSARKRKP